MMGFMRTFKPSVEAACLYSIPSLSQSLSHARHSILRRVVSHLCKKSMPLAASRKTLSAAVNGRPAPLWSSTSLTLPRAMSSVTMNSRGQWEQAPMNCTTFLWRIIL